MVVCLLHKLSSALMENIMVFLFPDYIIAVQNQQHSFLAMNYKLRDTGNPLMLPIPAKLNIMAGDRTLFFSDTKMAWELDGAEESHQRIGLLGASEVRKYPQQKSRHCRQSRNRAL